MAASSKKAGGGEGNSTAFRRRPRFPPLKSLMAFEAAARNESFTQGARELGLTASAVSHHIQQLEEFLGVPLFQRHAGRAMLTVMGRTYARELEQAFSAIATATSLVAPQSQGGYLTIAVPNSFSVKWLQPRIETFLRAHPLVRVRLTTLHTHELDANRYDIAIVHAPKPPGIKQIEPLILERLRPLCSPKLAADVGLRSLGDLAETTLIHSNTPVTWVDYLREIGASAIIPKHELWLDRSAMAIDVAVAGLGVVLESEVLAEAELRDGRLVAPFSDEAHEIESVSYYLIRSSSLQNAFESKLFENWLRAEIGSGGFLSARP